MLVREIPLASPLPDGDYLVVEFEPMGDPAQSRIGVISYAMPGQNMIRQLIYPNAVESVEFVLSDEFRTLFCDTRRIYTHNKAQLMDYFGLDDENIEEIIAAGSLSNMMFAGEPAEINLTRIRATLVEIGVNV
jgi:hypothetical protein